MCNLLLSAPSPKLWQDQQGRAQSIRRLLLGNVPSQAASQVTQFNLHAKRITSASDMERVRQLSSQNYGREKAQNNASSPTRVFTATGHLSCLQSEPNQPALNEVVTRINEQLTTKLLPAREHAR